MFARQPIQIIELSKEDFQRETQVCFLKILGILDSRDSFEQKTRNIAYVLHPYKEKLQSFLRLKGDEISSLPPHIWSPLYTPSTLDNKHYVLWHLSSPKCIMDPQIKSVTAEILIKVFSTPRDTSLFFYLESPEFVNFLLCHGENTETLVPVNPEMSLISTPGQTALIVAASQACQAERDRASRERDKHFYSSAYQPDPNKYSSTVQVLSTHKANPSTIDNSGRNALSYVNDSIECGTAMFLKKILQPFAKELEESFPERAYADNENGSSSLDSARSYDPCLEMFNNLVGQDE